MSKIIVTGASGFLGASVLARFNEANLPAIGVSRRSDTELLHVANYGDIQPCDIIVHLAEEPDRAKVNREDTPYFEQAADVVRRLCDKAGRVIYASSGTVYGDQTSSPFTVQMPAYETDKYSRMKIAHERIVTEANGLVLRLSNLYGRRMSSNNVLSDILKQIPGEGDLRVRDDRSVRDFLFVESAACAFVMASRSSFRGVLNIGSGVATSIGDLARSALSAAGQSDREIVATNPSGHASFNVLDVRQTRDQIGWSNSGTVRDYVSDYFENGVSVVAG